MMVQSSISKYLACCVCVLLTLAVQTSGHGRCDSLLSIPADYDQTGSRDARGNGNIHARSLSPWVWRPSTEENRIPATIWEAECSTADCGHGAPGPLGGAGLNSVPVYQKLLVLQPTANRKCYSASYLSVAVGCTCVTPQTD